MFEIKTDAEMLASYVGSNANFVGTGGSTVSGFSTVALASTTVGTGATKQLKILGAPIRPDVLLGIYTPDELESAAPSTARTDALKKTMRKPRVIDAAPEVPPADVMEGEIVDMETGEIQPAEPVDTVAELLQALESCQSIDELEQHREAVAKLTNGDKARAIETWKIRKTALTEK
jgi:hypothetical protein